MLATDPNPLIIVAAGRAFESNKSFSTVRRFPCRGVCDVEDIRIVRRYRNAHRAGAEAVVGGGKALGERPPRVSAVRGFEKSAASADERFTAANFPRGDARRPENGVNRLRVRWVEGEIGSAGVFVFVQNLGKSPAAVGGTKNAALGVRAVGMAFGGDEDAIRIFWIDENRSDLLCITKTKMRPGSSGVGGFINSVPGGEIRALQSFTTADVNNIWIGWRNGEGADGAGRLIIENRIPGIAEVRRFPDAAVDCGHVKDIRLARHAADSYGAPAAKRANTAPAHFVEKFLIILLRGGRNGRKQSKHESGD